MAGVEDVLDPPAVEPKLNTPPPGAAAGAGAEEAEPKLNPPDFGAVTEAAGAAADAVAPPNGFGGDEAVLLPPWPKAKIPLPELLPWLFPAAAGKAPPKDGVCFGVFGTVDGVALPKGLAL